jgi:hypothetical protein
VWTDSFSEQLNARQIHGAAEDTRDDVKEFGATGELLLEASSDEYDRGIGISFTGVSSRKTSRVCFSPDGGGRLKFFGAKINGNADIEEL